MIRHPASAGKSTTSPQRAWVAIAFMFLGACAAMQFSLPVTAQEPRQAGKGGRILLTLDWADVPLRDRLLEFGKKYDVPVFLDRRVDPDQKIELSARDQPVEGVLALVADKLNLGTCRVGKVHYIGPKATAAALPGLIVQRKADAGKLSAAARVTWTKVRELKWDEAASPREIATALAEDAGLTLENAEKIPHDVWPAYDFAAMPLADRLSLVLAGFDMTWRLSPSGNIRVVPITKELLASAGAQVTRTEIEPGVTKTTIKGPAKKVFSMTVQKQPAGAVVNTVAKQLGKQFKYDPELRDKLREEVSFTVKDVGLEELLTKTLTPLGLSCKVTEEALEVVRLK